MNNNRSYDDNHISQEHNTNNKTHSIKKRLAS